jgi:ring-1,2-phenylacetyl-CoA epoxidase subunit PaaC
MSSPPAQDATRTGDAPSAGAATSDAGTATMVSLIGSLADNKSALGRRYGEWAVSAPTIESAVAAAAMAQDELGHARSTYPVLAKLGVTRDEDTLESGFPLGVIEHELPDWASVIAANLVVDGILTTFVASARASSIEPLAQRARKILQEEGAHRRHAEAWARRIVLAGGSDRELLLSRISEMWSDAARWPGPEGDQGYREAVLQGMVSEGPEAVRDRVRHWLTGLLREHGVEVTLEEPVDWAGWNQEHRR